MAQSHDAGEIATVLRQAAEALDALPPGYVLVPNQVGNLALMSPDGRYLGYLSLRWGIELDGPSATSSRRGVTCMNMPVEGLIDATLLYLRANGWEVERRDARRSIWVHRTGARVFVPGTPAVDSADLLRTAVHEIARAEGNTEEELMIDLAAIPLVSYDLSDDHTRITLEMEPGNLEITRVDPA